MAFFNPAAIYYRSDSDIMDERLRRRSVGFRFFLADDTGYNPFHLYLYKVYTMLKRFPTDYCWMVNH